MALQTSCQSGVRLMCSSLEPKICQKNKKVKNIQLLAQKMEPRPSNFMDMIIGNRSKWYMHVERNDCIRQLSDSTNQQKNNIIDYHVWVNNWTSSTNPNQISFQTSWVHYVHRFLPLRPQPSPQPCFLQPARQINYFRFLK